MGNTYFKHRRLHKYTRVERGQDGVEIKSITDAGCEVGERNGTRPLRPYVVLCKVRLVGKWIKRREIVVGARRIRSETLREHQYKEGYVRSLEGKGVKWDGDNNVEYMWEKINRAMVEVQKTCVVQ